MAEFKYELASPVTVIQVNNVTVSEFHVDFKPEEQTVQIRWHAQDDERYIRPIVTDATMAQFNTFLDNYATYPGTTFEEKLLGLAETIASEIPAGGSVVPVP